jgi:hypothetical protein
MGRAAAIAAAVTLPIDLRRVAAPSLGETWPPCAILSLDGDDSLAESVAGFESALREAQVPFTRSLPAHEAAVVIVPGVVRIPRRTAAQTTNALVDGATVILESGAVFGAADSRELRDHRDMLRHLFGIEIDPPVSLWPAHGIPYVEYTWPVAVRVRDFSRVVPVRQHDGEVIGRAAGLPVAVHRCQGRGTLIFLGSPLGPALWSRDAEASRWLGAVLGKRVEEGRG